MSETAPAPIERIVRFGLNTRDIGRIARFYMKAFDCKERRRDRVQGPEFEPLMGVSGGASRIILALGEQSLELLQFDTPGKSYPRFAKSTDSFFQHFAIIVDDMSTALAALAEVPGWTPITTFGPQILPPNTGGVNAFKFRDPDGHPLELLQFPEADEPDVWKSQKHESCFLGIDHSAIGVSHLSETRRFYDELGFREMGRTLNSGIGQECLDQIRGPKVDVVAMSPARTPPHLELLHYRNVQPRMEFLQSNDVAATRLILARAPHDRSDSCREDVLLMDPDGHRLHILSDPAELDNE